MALPNEHFTPKMIELRAQMSRMSPAEFGALPFLDREDHEMIGVFIQHFNFIDFNLRRAIEIFEAARLLKPFSNKTYPPDSELAATILSSIEATDVPASEKEEAKENLSMIAYARPCRNLIGHFAARRYPNEDVFVFASKNDRDARKTLGRKLNLHYVQTVVAGRPELQNLTLLLAGPSNWLAHRIPAWDESILRAQQ